MTAHDHRSYVDGCYRCELGRDEVTDPVTRQQVLDACAEVMSPPIGRAVTRIVNTTTNTKENTP